MSIAVYPGSFDPITLGHLNIIRRASRVFDQLYVCVMVNSEKSPMFSLEERMDFIKRATERFPNVKAEYSSELLVRYAKSKGASCIVKGLRAITDFEMEFQMALTNKKLEPDIETLFLTADEKYSYLSSSVVKEMAKYGADLTHFLPHEIIEDVVKKTQYGGKR